MFDIKKCEGCNLCATQDIEMKNNVYININEAFMRNTQYF